MPGKRQVREHGLWGDITGAVSSVSSTVSSSVGTLTSAGDGLYSLAGDTAGVLRDAAGNIAKVTVAGVGDLVPVGSLYKLASDPVGTLRDIGGNIVKYTKDGLNYTKDVATSTWYVMDAVGNKIVDYGGVGIYEISSNATTGFNATVRLGEDAYNESRRAVETAVAETSQFAVNSANTVADFGEGVYNKVKDNIPFLPGSPPEPVTNECPSEIWKGLDEPTPKAWAKPGCGKDEVPVTLTPQEYKNATLLGLPEGIKAIYIPPHMIAAGYTEPNFNGTGVSLPAGIYVNFNNAVKSLKLTRVVPWERFKVLHCTGQLDSKPNVKRLWEPPNCDQVMTGYCASDPGKSDILCSCKNTTIPTPACNSAACVRRGYKFADLVKGCESAPYLTCPEYSQVAPAEKPFVRGYQELKSQCTSVVDKATEQVGRVFGEALNNMNMTMLVLFLMLVIIIVMALEPDESDAEKPAGASNSGKPADVSDDGWF